MAPLDSLNVTQMNLPLPLNRLNAKYTSDDGMIGGFIEVRGGGTNRGDTGVVWNYGWIDWRFNPNVYLRVGRQTQAFAIGVGRRYPPGYGSTPALPEAALPEGPRPPTGVG